MLLHNGTAARLNGHHETVSLAAVFCLRLTDPVRTVKRPHVRSAARCGLRGRAMEQVFAAASSKCNCTGQYLAADALFVYVDCSGARSGEAFSVRAISPAKARYWGVRRRRRSGWLR